MAKNQLVEIFIEKRPHESNVVECCINGRNILILRGEKVMVTMQVYDLLCYCGII